MAQLQDKYHEELSNEMQGVTYSTYLSDKKEIPVENAVDNEAPISALEQSDKETADMSKFMMSRKKRGVYEAIEVTAYTISSVGGAWKISMVLMIMEFSFISWV